jgi:hypothetical protein
VLPRGYGRCCRGQGRVCDDKRAEDVSEQSSSKHCKERARSVALQPGSPCFSASSMTAGCGVGMLGDLEEGERSQPTHARSRIFAWTGCNHERASAAYVGISIAFIHFCSSEVLLSWNVVCSCWLVIIESMHNGSGQAWQGVRTARLGSEETDVVPGVAPSASFL